jgi:2-octaprenylphenol hydroxylase
MQHFDCEVLIVGSGIVGATLACALLQSGMKVIMVEAKPQSPNPPIPITEVDLIKQAPVIQQFFDLRTFALTRASEQIFRNLGVWEMMMAQRVSPFREMQVWDANGSGAIHFDSALLNEPTLGYIVEQTVIQTALTTRLTEFDNLTVYRPAKVDDFRLINSATGMQVQLDNGEVLTTRLLISAEGAQSSLRTMAGIRYHMRDHGQQAIVATVETEKPHQQTAWQRFLPTGPLAFLPLSPPQTSSIVWSIHTPLAQHLMKLEPAEFNAELATSLAFQLGAIINSSERATFPLQSRHVFNYVQPRLALVGDAAHTILPLAGQGLNLGLLDAATLSEVILTAYQKNRDFGHYQKLRRYERWRKGENLAMLKIMEGFKYLFESRLATVNWARNIGLSLTDNLSPLKQVIIQQAMGLSGQLPKLAQ